MGTYGFDLSMLQLSYQEKEKEKVKEKWKEIHGKKDEMRERLYRKKQEHKDWPVTIGCMLKINS